MLFNELCNYITITYILCIISIFIVMEINQNTEGFIYTIIGVKPIIKY